MTPEQKALRQSEKFYDECGFGRRSETQAQSIEPEDLNPFDRRGGLGRFCEIFGE